MRMYRNGRKSELGKRFMIEEQVFDRFEVGSYEGGIAVAFTVKDDEFNEERSSLYKLNKNQATALIRELNKAIYCSPGR